MIGMMLPSHAMRTKSRGVSAVVPDRSSASVCKRIEIAAGIVVTGVCELEIEPFVGAHVATTFAGCGYAAHDGVDASNLTLRSLGI